jgi:hypothetical protein
MGQTGSFCVSCSLVLHAAKVLKVTAAVLSVDGRASTLDAALRSCM